MYAIIETGGKQYWVVPGEVIKVEKLETAKGTEVTIPALWAVGDAKDGQEATVSRKASVVAEVVNQKRDPKILVFKKRQKKAYKRMHGHRQSVTELRIKTISLN